MDDLLFSKVDFLTIGQYLQPSIKHYPLQRYVHPDEFEHWRNYAIKRNFKYIESGPLVRSSYHADKQVDEATLRIAPILK